MSDRTLAYKPSPRSLKMSKRRSDLARKYLTELDLELREQAAERLGECCLWDLPNLRTQIHYLVKAWEDQFKLYDPWKLTSWSQIISAYEMHGQYARYRDRVLEAYQEVVDSAAKQSYADLPKGDWGDLHEEYDYEYGEGSFVKEVPPLLEALVKIPGWLKAYDRFIEDLKIELEWREHKFKHRSVLDPHPPDVEDLEVVWHATTAYPQIMKEGFKLRSQLESSGGLGGSMSTSDWEKEGISFTGNEEVAESILDSYWDMAELLQGPRDKKTLMEFAQRLEVPEETIREYIRPLWRMSDDEVLSPRDTFGIARHIIGQASVIGTYYDPVYIIEEGTIRTFLNMKPNDAGVVEAVINTTNPDVKYLRSMDEWRVPLEAIVSYGPVGSQQVKMEKLQKTASSSNYLYHVTLLKNLSSIAKLGLIPGASGNWPGYAGHAQGKVFLTEEGAVNGWIHKVRYSAAAMDTDYPVEEGYVPVVLRVPRQQVEEGMSLDELGSTDVRSGQSYFVEDTIHPEELEVYTPAGWVYVDEVDPGEMVEYAMEEAERDEDDGEVYLLLDEYVFAPNRRRTGWGETVNVKLVHTCGRNSIEPECEGAEGFSVLPLGKVPKTKKGSAKFVYTGWSCPAGPASFVDWLVGRGDEISYEEFAQVADVETLDLDETQMEVLPTDFMVVWLRTEMPSGKPAYVMQHSGIEHLFLQPGDDYYEESSIMEEIAEWSDETYGTYWPEELNDEQIAEMRKVFFPQVKE